MGVLLDRNSGIARLFVQTLVSLRSGKPYTIVFKQFGIILFSFKLNLNERCIQG